MRAWFYFLKHLHIYNTVYFKKHLYRSHLLRFNQPTVHRCVPADEPIDLLNVAFGNTSTVPDRLTAHSSLLDLQHTCPGRMWNLVEVRALIVAQSSHTCVTLHYILYLVIYTPVNCILLPNPGKINFLTLDWECVIFLKQFL